MESGEWFLNVQQNKTKFINGDEGSTLVSSVYLQKFAKQNYFTFNGGLVQQK